MTREELDRIILSIPGARVTEDKERLDFSVRLPVCFGDGRKYYECYRCTLHKFMKYSLDRGELDDIVVFGCSGKLKLGIKEDLPYQIFCVSVDFWSTEQYEEALPLIIETYKPEFIKNMYEIEPKDK